MTLNLTMPSHEELKPRITVFGVGGAGGNAVDNMIEKRLEGVEFVVANTDAQALQQSTASTKIQMGVRVIEHGGRLGVVVRGGKNRSNQLPPNQLVMTCGLSCWHTWHWGHPIRTGELHVKCYCYAQVTRLPGRFEKTLLFYLLPGPARSGF